MPSSYRIDPEHQVLLGRVWGKWTMRDVIQFREEAAADPAFSTGMPQLVDLTQVVEIELSVREVIQLAMANPLGSHAPRAYVAPNDAVFGTLRAYEANAGGDEAQARVFRTTDEAREWLGLA
jgi:hypothetical protein